MYPFLYIICWTPDAVINLRPKDANPSKILFTYAFMTMLVHGSVFGTFFLNSNKVVKERWYYFLRNNLIIIYDTLGLDWGGLISDEEAIAAGWTRNSSVFSSSTNESQSSKTADLTSSSNTRSTRSGSWLSSAFSTSNESDIRTTHTGKSSSWYRGDHSVSMNRPSVLNLGPDASDVTEEVDYIHPKRKARTTRASEHAIETTGQMHRITRMASVTEDSIPNTMNPIVNPTMNPTNV